jgi:O-antigen/teichoic acid export membrane protein
LASTLGKFIANIGYGGLRGGVLFVNTLVLTPILISRLGREQFAVLALAAPFLRYGFNGVFDLGLATGLVRFVSRDFAAGDHESINRHFSSALLLYIVAGLSMQAAFKVLSPLILSSLMGLDTRLYYMAQTAFSHLLWIYALLLLSNPFFALLMGIQKVHLSHFVGTVSLLIELIGILALLPFGLTISRVVDVYAIGAVLSTLLCVLLVRRHFPSLRLRSASRGGILDLVHYTARWSVTVSTSLLSPIIDKLILARFVGLSYVTIYEAAARLVEILKRATQLFLLPLFPMAGAVVPNQSVDQARAFYRRFFRVNVAFNAGLYLIPATLTFGIMRIWLGPEISKSAGWTFLVLSVTWFMLALVYPAAMILAATGRMRLLVTSGLGALFFNLLLSPVLARHYGFEGLLAGTIFAYGGQALFILASLQSQKGFALQTGSSLRTATIAVAGAVVPGLVFGTIYGLETSMTRILLVGAFSIVIYCLTLLTVKENREMAFSVTLHCRKLVITWLTARRAGQILGT